MPVQWRRLRPNNRVLYALNPVFQAADFRFDEVLQIVMPNFFVSDQVVDAG